MDTKEEPKISENKIIGFNEKEEEEIMDLIFKNKKLIALIKKSMIYEIKNIIKIITIYAKKENKTLNECLKTLFIPAIGQHINLGQILPPYDDKFDEYFEEMFNDNNNTIRELTMCMSQFAFGHRLAETKTTKGTMIMLDIILNQDKYKDTKVNDLMNCIAISKKKEMIKTFFAYDQETTLEFIKKLHESEKIQFDVTHLLLISEMNRTRWTPAYFLSGSLSAELKGVEHVSKPDREKCLKTISDEEIQKYEKFSERELNLKKSRFGLGEFSVGRCMNQPNEKMMIRIPETGGIKQTDRPSIDLTIRKKYGSVISGQISGHTLVNLAMANLHIPEEYKINGEYTMKMMKKRYYLILLGMIVWMVPLDHSIWEILLAGNSSIMDFYGGWFRACEFSVRHNLKSQVQEIIDQVMIITNHDNVIVNVPIDNKPKQNPDKYSFEGSSLILTRNKQHKTKTSKSMSKESSNWRNPRN